jgi:hypothetical protein
MEFRWNMKPVFMKSKPSIPNMTIKESGSVKFLRLIKAIRILRLFRGTFTVVSDEFKCKDELITCEDQKFHKLLLPVILQLKLKRK